MKQLLYKFLHLIWRLFFVIVVPHVSVPVDQPLVEVPTDLPNVGFCFKILEYRVGVGPVHFDLTPTPHSK